jgi:hypothetical protein
MSSILLTLGLCSILGFVLVILWFQFLFECIGQMQLCQLGLGKLSRSLFWRFLFGSALCGIGMGCTIIIVSVFDPHYPIYRFPERIAYFLMTSLGIGLGLGLSAWLYAKIAPFCGLIWPPSEDEKRAGKKLFWSRPRFLSLSEDEKAFLRKLSSFGGLFRFLIEWYLMVFVLLPVAFVVCGLWLEAMHSGFPTASTGIAHQNAGSSHHDHYLGVIFVLVTLIAVCQWSCIRVWAWLVFRKSIIIK